MSCISFYPSNLVQAPGVEYYSNSEDAFYPPSNMGLDFTTKTYRSAEGTTQSEIVIDLKTIESVDTFIIVPSSINGWGISGDITLEANATANFTSPAYSTTLTPDYTFDIAIKDISPAQSFRYWRVYGANPSGNFVEISKIMLGQKTEITTNAISYGWSFENQDTSRITTNRYGQKYIDIIGNKKILRASYEALNISEVETLLDIFEKHGTKKPIWVVFNNDETIISDKERFSGYYYFTARPSVTNSNFALYETSFTLEEAL